MNHQGEQPFSICVVTQQLGKIVSGVGLHAKNLVTHLVNDGHRVWVIAPEDQRPEQTPGYRFIGVPKPLFSNNQARWISLSLSFRPALIKLRQEIQFDIVHFTDLRESLFCQAGPRLVGNINDTYSAEIEPLSYYRLHYSSWMQRWLYYHFVHGCEKAAIKRMSAVLANSRYTAMVIQKQYQPDASRIFVVHKSIESDAFQNARELRNKVTKQYPVVLFIGGNMQRKGLPDLISAAPKILKDAPDTEFWVVGNDDAGPRMSKLCRDLGVEQRFRFLGRKTQSELAEIYAQSDIFCMPSLTEAFGVVFLEAMSAGVPVIGSRTGGIVEIVQDEVNGLLVNPGDQEELSQKVLRLLKDTNLRERLQDEGMHTVKHFTVDKMMAETYQVYRTVIEKG